jgi:hypothetical protein
MSWVDDDIFFIGYAGYYLKGKGLMMILCFLAQCNYLTALVNKKKIIWIKGLLSFLLDF